MTTARVTSLPALVLTGLLVAATAPAATTAAGSYTVSACSPTTSPGVWQQINTFPAAMTSGNQCGGPMIGPIGGGDPGALFGEDLIGSTGSVPAGAQAGWSFTAPAGTTITSVSYYRNLATGNNGDWVAGLISATGAPLDSCQTNPHPCSSPNNQVAVAVSGLSTSGLFLGIECEPVAPDTACLAGSTQHFAQADMYSVKVTLSEPGTPSVSNLGGALWGGAVVWGPQPVAFSAADPSGISQVVLDGPAGQLGLQLQSCDYSQTQPCPQLPAGSLSLNTAQLHDGPETITLLVTDAAGNTTSVQSPPIIVDNNGPQAPTTMTATPTGNGSNAIDLSWSDPPDPPQPVSGAFAQLCQTTCGAAVALNGSGGAQLNALGPGTYTIRLWLVDQAGRGSAANAATTAVTVPPVPMPPPPVPTPTPQHPFLTIRKLTWHSGELTILVSRLPKGAELHVELKYAHRQSRRLTTTHTRLRVRTERPRFVVLRVFVGTREKGKAITEHG